MLNLIIHLLIETLKPTILVACWRFNNNFWIAFLFQNYQQWWTKIRSTTHNKTKVTNNFKLNNVEQCQKLTKQKGKTYTIREALACREAEVDWGIPDEQLHIMEQVHATIIMIMLLRDLQNHKTKNRVKKNCWFFLFKKPCNKRKSYLCNNVLHLLNCWLHFMWVMQACRSFLNPNLPHTCLNMAFYLSLTTLQGI
jgi:hypothetical protein